MDGRQLFQGLVALGVPLNVLGGDGFQRDVGNGVAGFVDHIGAAVLTDLDGGDDVVQKSLRGDKIDHAHNPGALIAAGVEGGGHHDGQLPRNFADQRLGDIDIALEGLFYIFPVRVVLAVKQADAVGADEVAPLKAVHADPLVHNGPLLIQRNRAVGQLGDTACVHSDVFVGGQFLLNALRRKHRSLAHHLAHRGDGASVVQRDTGRPYRD